MPCLFCMKLEILLTTLICLKKGNVPWLRNLKKTLGPMYKQIEKSGCPMGFYTGPN